MSRSSSAPERIQGAGGVKIPPASYTAGSPAHRRKYDVLLMLDEVITGYGRTGAWFAAQSMGITPDTITTAKALTSGYQPLSALLVGDRISATLVEGAASSTTATPIRGTRWPARGPKNLEIIEREGLIERVRDDTGPYFAQSLQERQAMRWSARCGRSVCSARSRIVGDKATKERFDSDGSPWSSCAITLWRVA